MLKILSASDKKKKKKNVRESYEVKYFILIFFFFFFTDNYHYILIFVGTIMARVSRTSATYKKIPAYTIKFCPFLCFFDQRFLCFYLIKLKNMDLKIL